MRSWAKCGGDRTTATRVLLSRIDPKDYRTGWALKCLGEVGEASPEVAALITPLLQDRDHRAAAAEAAMHLGIEPATATRVLLERATRPRPHGDDYDHQAMELLKKAARAGLLHMETLRAGLDDPNAAMRGTALTAMGCSGARAGPYLARIRELYADPRFEPRSIDHVIKQIEWAIEHPEGAK